MKIGILTQPLHTNYGGLLQAFALQKTLRDMGHEALTVDYTRRPRRCTLPYRFARRCAAKFLFGRKIALFPKPLSAFAGTHTRRFVEENVRTTRKIFAPARAKDFAAYGFEAFVVGSDQTWRPAYSPHMPTFFLDFLGDDDAETRRVAYAASFGKDTWEEFSPRLTRLCARLAKKFHAISVREDSGVALCEARLGVRAEHLLDPTLLLEKADYCDVVARDEARGLLEARAAGTARRLFAYVLDEAAAKSALVREAAGTLGLEVEEIMPSAASRRAGTAVFPPVSAWLRGFCDAAFVVTDSFHGCVFSILFNRPFVAIGNASRGLSRFHSLLKTFGLESRLVLLGDEGFGAAARERVLRLVREEIDWARANATLARERARSRAFLESALSPRK